MNIHNLLNESLPYFSQYGLLLVFPAALIESETMIILSGVLCHQGILQLEWTVAIAALGAFIGGQVMFSLGRRFGTKIFARFPRLEKHSHNVSPWLKSNSDWIVFGSHFVYGTRIIAPILLGIENYSPLRYLLINAFSAGIWAIVAVGLGYFLGASTEQLFGELVYIEHLLLGIIVIMLIRWWYRYRKLNQLVRKP